MEQRTNVGERHDAALVPSPRPATASGRPSIGEFFRACRVAGSPANQPGSSAHQPDAAAPDGPVAVVRELAGIPGTTYACVSRLDTGRVLAETDRSRPEPAAPDTVLTWSRRTISGLTAAADHQLDDIMITADRSYHLVRQVPAPAVSGTVLLYLCLDRSTANLAVARRELAAPGLRERLLAHPAPTGSGSPTPAAPPRPQAPAPAGDPTPIPTADQRSPAADAPRRCLPKRTPAAERIPRPLPAAADAPPVLQQNWADDVDTMSRLVRALRKIAS